MKADIEARAPVSDVSKVRVHVSLVRTLSSRSPTIYFEVTQAFTVCSRGYQNN